MRARTLQKDLNRLKESLNLNVAPEDPDIPLLDFIEQDGRGNWQRAPHLEILCSKLEAVERGDINRLMVFLPPRSGKSEVTSKKFPAWYLGRHPDREIILASYAADLAYDFSRIARETLSEWGHLWGVALSGDSSAVKRWGLDGHRGGMMAAGVGGPITGRGAHVALIDDPIKNWQDAQSPVLREKAWGWYKSTLRTRLAPGGAIVLIMTRWHEDDLAGRLILDASEEWDIVKLPAYDEQADCYLWEARFSRAEYEATKKALGSHLWSAMYQQEPHPEEGGILKRQWWKFYKQVPNHFDTVLQSWDMTFKDLQTSDYVVGQVWGKEKGDYYLLDQFRARVDMPGTQRALKALSAKWPKAWQKLVEDTANGPAIIQTLRHEVSGLTPVHPKESKVARAYAVSPFMESGNVYLPDPSIAHWIHDFIEECSAFPNGTHDDQVDSCTQALKRLSMGVATVRAKPAGM